jgi:hypothetical protein
MTSILPLLIVSGVIGVSCVPLILQRVPPNRLYGIRTRRTLEDEALWYRVNRVGGWMLLVASLVSLALLIAIDRGSVALPEVVAFAGPILVALVACFIYLYVADRGAGPIDADPR